MKLFKALAFIIALAPAMAMAETNIAVLNLEGALAQSAEGKKFAEYLKSEYAPKQSQLKDVAAEGQALKAEYEKSGVFLSEDDRKAKIIEIQQKAKQFDTMRRNLEAQVNEDRKNFLIKMRPRINKALSKIAEDKEIDLIVQAESVVFAKPGTDISAALAEELDKAQ